MFKSSLKFALFLGLVASGTWVLFSSNEATTDSRSRDLVEIKKRVTPLLKSQLIEKKLAWGNPLFIRIFKEEMQLELWLRPNPKAPFQLFKTYPILAASGTLGPKLKEGDGQAPEGIYQVNQQSLNPKSQYHLSFNLGFPNAYDRAHQRTGSFLMVHGKAASIGCYAMGDPAIEEIYLLLEAALKSGQSSVSVHCFPFRLSAERLAQATQDEWFAFWNEELQPVYRAFETSGKVPKVEIRQSRYVVVP